MASPGPFPRGGTSGLSLGWGLTRGIDCAPRLVSHVRYLSKKLDCLLIPRGLGYARRCRCGVSFTRVTDGRFDTCRRSTLSCWRRIRISATSFVLGLKSEAMIWRISRRNSIIKWQGYRVSASRLAESNFRYTQVTVDTIDDIASVTRASGPSSFSARI